MKTAKRLAAVRSAAATRKVWMLTPGFYPGIGGAERQAQGISRSLMAKGWYVEVLTRRHTGYGHLGPLSRAEIVDGLPVSRLFSRGGGKVGSLLYVANTLWRLARYGRGGIYHAHDIGAVGWLAVLAARLLKGRSLIKLRSGRSNYERRFLSVVGRWQFATLVRLADRVLAVNSEVERWVVEMGIPPERVVRVPNSVDLAKFSPATQEQSQEARRSLGLPADSAIVLYVGRLERIKGVDVLLRGWATLRGSARDDARLVIVGHGERREELIALADQLGISSGVVFAGLQESVTEYYRAADLFVLPSRNEGLSNALVEAMACGLPAIASNVGGALDMVEDGANGVLFQVEDSEDLGRKLSRLLASRRHWAGMGAKARDMVIDYADMSVAAHRMDRLYTELG